MTILLIAPHWDMEPWQRRFSAQFPGRKVEVWPEVSDPAAVSHAICWKPPAGVLAGLSNLKAIHSLGAGVDHIFSDPQLPENIPLFRVLDADLATRMGEWVALHALLHHRRLPQYLAQQRSGQWLDNRDQLAARDVRVGIMGFGEMGRDAARKLLALGFDVAAWRRGPLETGPVPVFHGAEGLDAFLARTNILVCLLPLTQETRGILNASLFANLARDERFGAPVLLNAGRGGLQVEADILTALNDGTLGGASLDVFATEPLPMESPLWTHPKVVITPHNAAISDPEAVSAFISEQIRRIEAGEPTEGVVDRVAEY